MKGRCAKHRLGSCADAIEQRPVALSCQGRFNRQLSTRGMACAAREIEDRAEHLGTSVGVEHVGRQPVDRRMHPVQGISHLARARAVGQAGLAVDVRP